MNDARRLAARALPAAQVGLGLCLLARPTRSAQKLLGRRTAIPATWLVRALGGRLLAQGVVAAAVDKPTVARGGAAVDALHAASMIPLSLHGHYRRAAATSAAIATVSAAVTAWSARPAGTP